MDLMELEKIDDTVSGIADLLCALCTENEENEIGRAGLYTLYCLASDTAKRLHDLTQAAFYEGKSSKEAVA